MQKKDDIQITVKMNRETASVLMDACEFYARVLCGQFDEISSHILDNDLRKIRDEQGEEALHNRFDEEIQKRDDTERALRDARRLAFPELDPCGHYGLGYSKDTDLSYDLYMSVRHALAWHDHPEGGYGVNFDKPALTPYEKPVVEIQNNQSELERQ